MHFLFPHSTAVPVGLHNSLFLPRNSMQVCLAWLTPSASLSPVEEQPQLKATSFSVLGSLGTLERKVSQDYKSCIEVGWTFLRNSQSVGLGRHERRGGKAMIYCKGMIIYPVLIQAILTTQKCWVKGWVKVHLTQNSSEQRQTLFRTIILWKPIDYPQLISVFPNTAATLTTLNCTYCSPKLWI